jgi:hypothetical protein
MASERLLGCWVLGGMVGSFVCRLVVRSAGSSRSRCVGLVHECLCGLVWLAGLLADWLFGWCLGGQLVSLLDAWFVS